MASRPLYTPHPAALSALFGDVASFAASQPQVFIGTAGSLLKRENANNFRFYARQYYDGEGKKREGYVAGPIGDPGADATAMAMRARIDQVKAQTADLRMLGREGFQIVDPRTYATLASLHNYSIFRAGGVLIGSHAFGVLLNQLGVRAAAYATEDIDIARRERLGFETLPDASFLQMLCDSGVQFMELPTLDPRHPPSRFGLAGRARFHVDLLVPSPDAGMTTVPVPELQTRATSLPYLRYGLGESSLTPVLAREGCCMVRVPTPERFAVHKLIASQLRSNRDAKTNKDIQQACTILAVLAERHPDAIEGALERVPVSAKRYLRAALVLARPQLELAHPRAWEALSEPSRA